MPVFELKTLIACLVAVDIVIVLIFLFFIRKNRYLHQGLSLEKEISLFESLIGDSQKTAAHFKAQIEAKHRMIENLNEKLDRKIVGLNLLLNRADAILSRYDKIGIQPKEVGVDPAPQHEEILALAKTGCKPETIAEKLSLPLGEIKPLLDLNEKITRLRNEAGAS